MLSEVIRKHIQQNHSQASDLDNVTIESDDVLINITGASVARCCVVPSDVLPARVKTKNVPRGLGIPRDRRSSRASGR